MAHKESDPWIILDPDQCHGLRPEPDAKEVVSVFANVDPYPYNTGSGFDIFPFPFCRGII